MCIHSGSVLCNHVENMVDKIKDFSGVLSILNLTANSWVFIFHVIFLTRKHWLVCPFSSRVCANTREVNRYPPPLVFQEILCYSHSWDIFSIYTHILIASDPPLTPVIPYKHSLSYEPYWPSQDGKLLNGLYLCVAHIWYIVGLCPNYDTPFGITWHHVISLMT